MKDRLRSALQRALGLDAYLFLLANVKRLTYRWSAEGRLFTSFLRLIPPGAFVVDAGANVGFTTIPLARRASRGLVMAFEPLPANLATLRRMLRLWGVSNVRLHASALGSHDGGVTLRTPSADGALLTGLTAVSHPAGESADAAPQQDATRLVECRALDSVLEGESGRRPVAALKIDVEGYEREVLEGARRVLADDRPVVLCEIWNTPARLECFRLLGSLGYVSFTRSEGRLRRAGPEASEQDFLCLPEEQADALLERTHGAVTRLGTRLRGGASARRRTRMRGGSVVVRDLDEGREI